MAVMDAYIRVSRVGNREGEAYRSPSIQLDEIKRCAERETAQLGKVLKDEDVSGGKAVEDRGVAELIERAEAGISEGVIVYALDRFGRDELDAALAIKRLTDAGARLLSATEGIDSSREDQGSKMAMRMHLMFAEAYLDRVKSNWRASNSRAVADGIHIASKAPIGYLRHDQVNPEYDAKGNLIRNGRLLIDPVAGPAVRSGFEMRARGDSHVKIANFLRETLGRPIAKSTISGMLRNRAYLGEARGPGGIVNKDAHEAIVTPELFAAANQQGRYHPRDGSLAAQASLSGLCVCAACGGRMSLVGNGGYTNGKRKPSYVCDGRHAEGNCPAPASAACEKVDAYVLGLLHDSWEDVQEQAGTREQEYVVARKQLEDAQANLDDWLESTELRDELSRETYQRGLIAAEKALEAARRKVWDLSEHAVPDDATVLWDNGKPWVYEVWGDDPAADRRHLARYIKEVRITRCDPKRRRWQPISERIEVVWIGAAG